MPLDFRLAGIDCTSHEENWTLERPYLSRFVEYQRKGEGTEHNSSLNVIMSSNLSAKFAFQCRDIPRGVHKSQKFCQKFRSHACWQLAARAECCVISSLSREKIKSIAPCTQGKHIYLHPLSFYIFRRELSCRRLASKTPPYTAYRDCQHTWMKQEMFN